MTANHWLNGNKQTGQRQLSYLVRSWRSVCGLSRRAAHQQAPGRHGNTAPQAGQVFCWANGSSWSAATSRAKSAEVMEGMTHLRT